jgi:hypothetical protein
LDNELEKINKIINAKPNVPIHIYSSKSLHDEDFEKKIKSVYELCLINNIPVKLFSKTKIY